MVHSSRQWSRNSGLTGGRGQAQPSAAKRKEWCAELRYACPRFRGSNWNQMENILLDRPASMRDRIAMYNANALKIGLFGANCSSGRSATKVPERWSASWPDCLRLARMADDAGIDFMLPIGRWKGYGGDTDFHGKHAGDHHLGGRPARRDRAHHRVRHRARAAVPSDHRGQGIRHRRSHRRGPLRPQPRGRLERGRVRDVRRDAARARRALRLRPGMARCREARLVRARRRSISTASSSSSRVCAPSPSPTAARGRSS